MTTETMPNMRTSLTILDVSIDNLDSAEAQESIAEFIRDRNGRPARKVFFANVHSLHLAGRLPDFLKTLQHADLVLADGSGLNIAGRLFGQPIRENLNGTDFTPRLLAMAEQKGWSVYLFGARNGVVLQAAAAIQTRFPSLVIAGCSNGFLAPGEEAEVIEDMRRKRPDIVLVGLGSPRQEQWIEEQAADIGAAVCLAVGGLFDFLAGKFRRAPRWMRVLGLEWLYRFLQDPKTKWDRVFIEIPGFLLSVSARALFSGRKRRGALT